MVYRHILRPFAFRFTEPEWIHRQTLSTLELLAPQTGIKNWLAANCCHPDPRLSQTLWGMSLVNPLGLAAGFDKQGQGVGVWEDLGFGWAEIGTVTRHRQPGNPRPRLFRLAEDRAIINRMGFNNNGADQLAQKLENRPHRIPLGINLGKSKITPLDQAAADYLYSFQKLYALGDYFVINVSSPNTPGLRELQQPEYLREIFSLLQGENYQLKPLLVKIAPELTESALVEVVQLVTEFRLNGIIATNTTTERPPLTSRFQTETGGLSGAPLTTRSTEVIHQLWQLSEGKIPIVGVGGISSAADAWEKIIHGASLLQLYTAWVYEGPLVVKRILEGLSARCEKEGITSLQEVVGSAHRG